MHRLKVIFISLCCFAVALAQDNEQRDYRLTTLSRHIGISFLQFADPYLSPLMYDGNGLTINRNTHRYLLNNRTDFSSYTSFSADLGMAYNPPVTAMIFYIGANAGYGIHYHFPKVHGFQFLLGGIWDIDFVGKMSTRNVNNPFNLDLATNLNASAIARTQVMVFRQLLKFELQVQSPFIGAMFVPQLGATYYEMFSIPGNLSNAFHFTSPHNKYGYKANFAMAVPLNRTVWRLGLHAENLKHFANESLYIRKNYAVTIGLTHDFYIFAGKKRIPPANFKSTFEL